MATTSRKKLREEKRLEYLNRITEFLENEGEQVLRVGSNQIAFPITDKEGNEDFIRITIAIPTGKADEPWDGYMEATGYEVEQKEKEEKAQKRAEAKKKKMAADAERRKKEAELKKKRLEGKGA